MPRMDVTPQELRDSDIKPAFRGYDPDVVNELLDRAASTLETQNEKIRLLTERLASAQNDTGGRRETEDLLHKTLLLAQRTADEEVAQAQDKARGIVAEAEGKARAMIGEAELEVRRITEVERRRIEEEILELASRRDALVADVRSLEVWESDFRQRVIRLVEADLDAVRARAGISPGPQPSMSNVELPEAMVRRNDPPTQAIVVDTDSAARQAPAQASEPPAATPPSAPADQPARSSGFDAPQAAAGTPRTTSEATEIADATTGETPAVTSDEVLAPPPPVARPRGDIDLDLEAEADVKAGAVADSDLDDDEFFATLREAVRDDAPLGPRDEALFDQDHEPTFREMFRRRR